MSDKPVDQEQFLTFVGYKLTNWTEDTDWKITRINYMCGTNRRAMKSKLSLELQLKLNKTAKVLIATYGSETWIVRRNHETRMKTAEIKSFLE
jgi:hypothetical protein